MSGRTIVITGASSGIGAALARHYAAPGITLALIGRDLERLGQVGAACCEQGAEVHTGVLDVRDRKAVQDWLLAFDRHSPVDLLFVNAGVARGARGFGEPFAAGVIEEIETNLLGAVASFLPLLPAMVARQAGQIALISSIAGLVPLPDWPGYSATKAGLLSFGLALRAKLHRHGVKVNVVCPGFITTPMAASFRGWKPMEMPVERAVQRIARGLDRDKAVIAFPWPLVMAARSAALLPEGVRRFAIGLFRQG